MRHTFWFLYIFVGLGLQGSHISSEKKTKKIVKEQAGVHATRMQNIRVLSLKSGVDIGLRRNLFFFGVNQAVCILMIYDRTPIKSHAPALNNRFVRVCDGL